MPVDGSFKDFVLDQLSGLPGITARHMFGGFGLYARGVFFGIISDGVLYLKTNERTRARYQDAGMEPFRPSAKQVLKNYYEVPSDVLESAPLLLEYTEEAISVVFTAKE